MLIYLFVCLVLFVNMLIAQITNTFVQRRANAERERYFSMMWMITRVELTSPLLCCVVSGYFDEIFVADLPEVVILTTSGQSLTKMALNDNISIKLR